MFFVLPSLGVHERQQIAERYKSVHWAAIYRAVPLPPFRAQAKAAIGVQMKTGRPAVENYLLPIGTLSSLQQPFDSFTDVRRERTK